MTGRHSPAVAQLDQFEADYLRRKALELVTAYETHDAAIDAQSGRMDRDDWLAWEGCAYVILKELARG